ncbi:MAG: carboxypeptidase regulatory-like domain-containing protein [Planctomycetes bacterium]|nr:carboxypeptidase regulatory-like domain-containing protein [Planctomycetota bacterium]
MKRILLPLLVVLALTLVAGLLWFQGQGKHKGAARDGELATSDAGGETALSGSSETLTAPDAGGQKPERASVANSGAGSLTSNVLEGEVRAPSDCGVDDQVEVYALARASDVDTLMNAIQPRGAGDTLTLDADNSSLVLAHARLDGNARFRLNLPRDAKRAHLILAGRSWFTRETLTVDVSGGKSFIALQAECGGWITGRVELPAGNASEVSALDGDVAHLQLSMMSFGAGGPGRFMGGFRRNERRALVKNGTFEMWAVDPRSSYTLEVSPKAFASTQVEVNEVSRGTATAVALRVDRGGTVRGRVLDEASAPVAGATVEARVSPLPFGMGDRTVRRTTSGADGAYELAAVTPGDVQISASIKDLVPAEAQKVELADHAAVTGIDFKLTSGETIAGVVRWKDGKPAAGAEVTASPERGQGGFGGGNGGGRGGGQRGGGMAAMFGGRGGEDAKAIADAEGRFVLRGLASGNHTLQAEALPAQEALQLEQAGADVRRRSNWRARESGIKSGTSDATVTLLPPLVVRGVVTSAVDGKPVTSYRVSAQGGGGGRGGGGGGPGAFMFGGGGRNAQDVNDEKGEFAFSFQREGSYKLTVEAPGFVDSDAVDVEVPAKADALPLAITLTRGATVKGIVRSPRGTAIANATVATIDGNSNPFGGRGMGGGGGDTQKARTDADGRFTLSDLKPGRIVLGAESLEWAKSEEKGVDLVAGQTVSEVELVLHDGGSIVGEYYEDGRAGAGSTISAFDMRNFASLTARTDAGGRFRFDHVTAGTWRLTALPSMSAISGMSGRGGGDGGMGAMFSSMKSTNAEVVDGQETRVVLGAPPEAPVTVSGKITQGGEPVSGVRITYMGAGDTFGPGMKTAQTAADGLYTLALDKPGEYSVTVRPNGAGMSVIEFVETVKPVKEAVIDIALPDARISGRVRTPEGEAAKGVRVSLTPATSSVGGSMMGGGFTEITTDDDGNFDVKTLRAGTYSLTVGGQGMGGFRGGLGGGGNTAKYGRKVVADIKLAESEWRKDIDVRLENAAGVDVEVVDDRGEKLMGASIFARDEAGRAVDRMSTVQSDVNGKARYAGLSPGAYTFSARKDSLSSGETAKVEVRAGGTATVRITLGQGTLLTVATVDTNDQPLRSSVSVTDEGGRDVAGLMSAQDMMGRFARGGVGSNEQKIGPLAPGKYLVKAVASNGKTIEKTVTLTGQPERKMTLSFPD